MKTPFLIVLTLICLQVSSQNQPKPEKKNSCCLKLSSFNLSIQPLMFSNSVTGFSDLQRLMPANDPMFNPSLKNYNTNNPSTAIFNFNMKLALTSKPNRELMIGIAYLSGIRRSYDFFKSSTKHVDTINVQDYTFYVDSTYFSGYSFQEYTKEVGVDISYIFRSEQSKKISVFAGFGLYVGYTFYSDVSVSQSKDSSKSIYTNPSNEGFYQYHSSSVGYFFNNAIEKTAKTDPSILFRGYVPVGLNWNLSKKNEFWKHVNLQFQAAFGLEYRYITNDKGYLNPYFGMSMFGIRYTF